MPVQGQGCCFLPQSPFVPSLAIFIHVSYVVRGYIWRSPTALLSEAADTNPALQNVRPGTY